ncbi:hypothetical protein QJQ45_012245 [Haematococcus lacustris]|nr:hypothetical protein QJQ45_012245 [Haematococcus lacustris]
MAFHTASDALRWARDFQQGLLHLAWPEQLLQLEAGAPVWAVPGASQDTVMLRQYSTANFDTTLGSRTNLPMADFSNDPNRQESHPWKLAVAARTFYACQWIAVPAQAGSRACLVFRGLRVRVGLHSGVHEAADAVFNKTTGRMQYGGRPLAIAKAVGDVGQGGMVLLSQAAFEQLPVSKLASFGLLLNMGDYVFTKDESLPATPIYQAFGRGLEQRTAFLQGPLRASQQLQAGVLDAPLGDVSIAFANMVGVGTLMAWNKTLASNALDLYHIHAINALQAVPQLLRKLPGDDGDAPALLPAGSADLGYLVELSGGLCLAAFLSPAAALLWALQLWADLLGAPWQEELLTHVLCEEVDVAQPPELLPEYQPFTTNTGFEVAGKKPPSKSPSYKSLSSGPRPLRLLPARNEVMSVLFRGPRLKVGVDVGRIHADVNPVTGRMTYRGRVMNRAARIADKAHSGSVWCSHTAWDWCYQACPKLMQQLDVKGHSLGQHSLKGVTESMHLVRVNAGQSNPRLLRGRPEGMLRPGADVQHLVPSLNPCPSPDRVSRRIVDHAASCDRLSTSSNGYSGQLEESRRALQALQQRAAFAATRAAHSSRRGDDAATEPSSSTARVLEIGLKRLYAAMKSEGRRTPTPRDLAKAGHRPRQLTSPGGLPAAPLQPMASLVLLPEPSFRIFAAPDGDAHASVSQRAPAQLEGTDA